MKYIGNGVFLPDIPARDLTDEEVKKFGKKFLLDTDLYEEIKEKKERIIEHGSDTIDESTDWS